MKPTIASISLATLALIANSAANALTITPNHNQQPRQDSSSKPIKISIETSDIASNESMDSFDLFVTLVSGMSSADLPSAAGDAHASPSPKSKQAVEINNEGDEEELYEDASGNEQSEWLEFDTRQTQLLPSDSSLKRKALDDDVDEYYDDDEEEDYDEFLDSEDQDLDDEEETVEANESETEESENVWQKLKQWFESKLTGTDQMLIMASMGYLAIFGLIAFVAIRFMGGKTSTEKKRAGYQILPSHSSSSNDQDFDFDMERKQMSKHAQKKMYRLPDTFTYSSKDVNKFFPKQQDN